MPSDSAIQKAFDAIDAAKNTDLELVAMVKGMMVGYDARWRDAGWETVSAEEEFILPIVNPEAKRYSASQTFKAAGKIDGVLRWPETGELWMNEVKNCNEDISAGSPYWLRMAIEAQVSQYVLAKWAQGQKLAGTVYDVVRRPGIRPKKVDSKMAAEIMTGFCCGFPLNHGENEYPGGVETPALYMYRVARESLDDPAQYFARQTVPRLDSEVLEYAQELWDDATAMREAALKERHSRNTGACMKWGKPCPYLGVCSHHDSFESSNWQRVERVHQELAHEGDGRDLITHSRKQLFKDCPRKHHYRYNLGIVRQNEEFSEGLYFGTLLHIGREAWLNHFRKDETTNERSTVCPSAAESHVAAGV